MTVTATMPRARKRTYRCRRHRRENTAPEPMKTTNQPAKRKQWTEDQITKAMELPQSGVMNQNSKQTTFATA